jgi:hypothetical protein
MQIQLDQASAERLRARAREERVSQAEIVRRALSRYLDETSRLPRQVIDAAMSAVGAVKSGPSDVSERHDFYLAEGLYEELEENHREARRGSG